MNKLSPSLLSADFTHLAEAVEVMEKNNVPYLHVDVMDGVFVPNISIGVPVVKSLRKITDLVLDVHLMIIDPERYIEAFANAGADIINIHYEACRKCKDTLIKIRQLGKSPAITIKPKTDWKEIIDLLPYVDMVLVMSVEPGFGGQKFIESTLESRPRAVPPAVCTARSPARKSLRLWPSWPVLPSTRRRSSWRPRTSRTRASSTAKSASMSVSWLPSRSR